MAFAKAKFTAALAVACISVSTRAARADEAAPPDVPPADRAASRAIDRSWLYLDDARVAQPGAVVGSTSVAYTNVGSNPDPTSQPYRAFAGNTAQPGALASVGAEVGVLPRISLDALGQMQVGGEGPGVHPGALAGARFDLTPPSWSAVHMTASGGYLRETWSTPSDSMPRELLMRDSGGANGAWASFAVAADVQRLRLGVTTLGEHVFAPGRDAVDIMLQAGMSYRALRWLRAGVEWVGQDLEESFADASEGGARHFVGPTAAVQLLQDRLTIVAGPSVGLSSRSPSLLGRLAVAYGF
ncbi:MAG TPA: hypothetical protein VKU41_33075 [Polyangiaceae bacterium]|nr:hypothetical protein [Polyangiaceae bacterium]